MPDQPVDAVAALQALVRIPTVSHRDPELVDSAAFDALLDEMERRFPLIHQRLPLTRIDTHGLLFHWGGVSDARPVVLMAHLDVVPVEGDWQHPPFSGDIVSDVDGVEGSSIWGRGTLDDKGCVVAICAAIEQLLHEGFTPTNDLWLSFGCNEEVSGTSATLAVEELQRRGVEPWFVLDEGGAIASEAFPGVAAPVGVIGLTEKGVTSVELRVEGRGGHASTPAKMGPTARIARAITRLDSAPMSASLPEPTVELMRRVGAHAALPIRTVLAGLGRSKPLLTRTLLVAGPETAAMTRTTFAITTLSGAPALNVIASTAKAGVNIRIMIGDTVAGALDHVRTVINDEQVEIDIVEQNEPSPISPMDEPFELLESTITEVFPDAVPSPYVMMAATDSRFFTAICERVYRFAPFRMTKAQRQSIHSYDEHLGVEAFLDGVRWYRRLIERLPA